MVHHNLHFLPFVEGKVKDLGYEALSILDTEKHDAYIPVPT